LRAPKEGGYLNFATVVERLFQHDRFEDLVGLEPCTIGGAVRVDGPYIPKGTYAEGAVTHGTSPGVGRVHAGVHLCVASKELGCYFFFVNGSGKTVVEPSNGEGVSEVTRGSGKAGRGNELTRVLWDAGSFKGAVT